MVGSPSEAAVQTALARSGMDFRVVRLSRSARTVRSAAQAIGCDPGAIVKSLVFRGEQSGKAYLAEVSGVHRANLDLLEKAAGERLALASPNFVLSRTGFPVGGVAPVGLRTRMEIFIDESLLARREIWTSAGSEEVLVRMTPSQLLQLTGGKTVRLSDPEQSPSG